MKEQKLLLLLAQTVIGTGLFLLYVQHVRNIFESRTNIASRSQLEREALLRREDALYFSFYKTLTESPNFWLGYEKLKNVTDIEYPHSVNVLKRFYVFPELVIAYFYHTLRYYTRGSQLPLISCWHAVDGIIPIEAGGCEGLAYGQAMQFYLECVWLLGGMTVFVLYMYGTMLSENLFGGIYAVASYIIFHSYASKIYERPMARENFAFPFIFLQMFYLCYYIERVTEQRMHKTTMICKLAIPTAISLLCWQFSSVIFATQIIIMTTPWTLTTVSEKISSYFTIDYAISQLVAQIYVLYLCYGSHQFYFSWQIGPAIWLFLISINRYLRLPVPAEQMQKPKKSTLKTILFGIWAAVSLQGTIIDILERTGLARYVDNTYALYRDLILHWSLQAKVNFATSLAACNPSYARMDLCDLWGLIKTLIVKPYCMYGVVMLAKFFRKWRKSGEQKTPNADHVTRAMKYVLEDFLEENHISMRDISNIETERELNECLKLLKSCDYDYERYKAEKSKLKQTDPAEHLEFMNDIKRLKQQIHKINDEKKHKLKQNATATATAAEVPATEEHAAEIAETAESEATASETEKPSKSSAAKKSEPNGNNEEITSSRRTRATKSNTKRAANINANSSAASNNKSSTAATTSSTNPTSAASGADSTDPNDLFSFQYLYSFVQMAIFTIMGLSIKKLFFLSFTQGCVIAPTIGSKFWYRKQGNIFWAVSLAVFATSLFEPGIMNVHEEYFPTRMQVDTDLHTMLEWINMNTERNAVFAGPVDIIGTVHLTTKRPIVNHAHLEMRHISERTEQVYSVYSRQQSSDVYNHCTQLKIQYLIISMQDCSSEYINDCDTLSIWDDIQPSYRNFPQFCSELAQRNIPSFLKVFSNNQYGIIKMFSQSVQINLKYSKMPEKAM